jgi:hypothetical protein
MKLIVVSSIFILGLFSCTKSEGLGGSSSISGSITMEDYNGVGTLVSSFDAQDYDVFIIYGSEDNIPDDDVKTSYDGTFEFDYLQNGTYDIYVYSACVSCPSGQDSVIVKSVEITEKKQKVDLGNIVVLK